MAYTVNQESSAKLTATFTDEAGASVTSMDSIKLTIYDSETDSIINSRDGSDITSSFSAGTLAFTFLPADMAMVGTGNTFEKHIVLIEWNYATTKKGKDEIELNIKRMEHKH